MHNSSSGWGKQNKTKNIFKVIHFLILKRWQKDRYCMIPFKWCIQSGKIHRDRNENGEEWFPGFGGTREWIGFMGTEFQFGKMKTILQMHGGDGYTTMWMYFMLLNRTLKNG